MHPRHFFVPGAVFPFLSFPPAVRFLEPREGGTRGARAGSIGRSFLPLMPLLVPPTLGIFFLRYAPPGSGHLSGRCSMSYVSPPLKPRLSDSLLFVRLLPCFPSSFARFFHPLTVLSYHLRAEPESRIAQTRLRRSAVGNN